MTAAFVSVVVNANRASTLSMPFLLATALAKVAQLFISVAISAILLSVQSVGTDSC